MINAPKTGTVKPQDLNIDHTYQRPLEPTRMGETGDLHPFSRHAVGSIAVSKRDDGTLWTIDGQHRMEKARRSGHDKTSFPAQIYSGLTVDEEAYLFGKLNKFRNLHPVYRFRARVVEGDKSAVIINQLVGTHGWRVGACSDKGCISAVAALEWVYDGAKIFQEGERYDALDRTLEILTASYGHVAQAVNASLIKGLGLVILRHDSALDTKKLVNELGRIEGGPNGLLGKAKALKHIRGGNLPHSVAEIIVEMHNLRRRRDVLPQWTRA